MVSRSKDTHTTNRVVRIDDVDWAAYALACKDKGLNRSADIRMHIKHEVAAWRKRQPEQAHDFDAMLTTEDGKVIVVEAKSTHRPKGR